MCCMFWDFKEVTTNQDRTPHKVNKHQSCLLPVVMIIGKKGKKKKYREGPVISLALCVPLFRSLSLSFFVCLLKWDLCSEGAKLNRTCGSCHPVLMPLFLFSFLLPMTFPPSSSLSLLAFFDQFSVIMCIRSCRCTATVRGCMCGAALLHSDTELGWNSGVMSYCSLFLM